MSLDAIHVFDVVPPAVLAEQLVAEAQRIAQVPVALYVIDIDGSHLLHMAGPRRLGEKLEARLAVGPELDADGLSDLREQLSTFPNVHVYATVVAWPRQRSDDRLRPARGAAQRARTTGGGSDHPGGPLHGCVRLGAAPQAADGCRRDPAKPAPAPHLSGHRWGTRGGRAPELRGRGRLVRRDRERRWGLGHTGRRAGGSTRAAASSAVALGALRASRRSGGDISEALVVMHLALRELPGPRAEMTAVVARWEPASAELHAGQLRPRATVILRSCGEVEPTVSKTLASGAGPASSRSSRRPRSTRVIGS